MTLQPGQRIREYSLIRKLGEEGSRVVWLAEKSGAGTIYFALKFLSIPPSDLAESRQRIEALVNVSEHPNVLPVVEVVIHHDQAVVISPFVAGGSLAGWMKRNGGKAPSLGAAKAMVSGILSGLEHLHYLSPTPLFMGHLQPDNVLLQSDAPRLTGFGIWQGLQKSETMAFAPHALAYMSLDALNGISAPASDIWSAGVIFYEMLTGRLPFSQKDVPSLTQAIAAGTVPLLPSFVPSHLQIVVKTALAKDPAQRYQSAKEMREALNAVVLTVGSSRRHFFIGAGVAVSGLLIGGFVIWNKRTNRPDNPLSLTDPDAKEQIPLNTSTDEREHPTRKINEKDGAEMVWIPAGEFTMGSTEEQIKAFTPEDYGNTFMIRQNQPILAEMPQHIVNLSGYWMYKNVVTVAMYRRFCDENQRQMPDAPTWGWIGNHPIVNVTWQDAKDYCTWAGVDLPSEAEWEKAARGTDGRIYPWGNKWNPTLCHCSKRYATETKMTAPVGNYPLGASPYGVLDMEGNVLQWCEDWYDADYYQNSPKDNPICTKETPYDPKGAEYGYGLDQPSEFTGYRVIRGASWDDNQSSHFRVAVRKSNPQNVLYFNGINGFRCVRRRD